MIIFYLDIIKLYRLKVKGSRGFAFIISLSLNNFIFLFTNSKECAIIVSPNKNE